MTETNDKLRAAILAEIERLRKAEHTGEGDNQMRVLGAFIDAALSNANRTRADLSRKLGIDNELLDAILDGILPDAELDDQTLTDIARAIDYEPNILRLMLGRTITPTQSVERTK